MADTPQTSQGLNVTALSQLARDVGPDALKTLLQALSAEVAVARISLKSHFDNRDWRLLEVESHALKSAARSFGADGLADSCLAIEQASQAQGEGHDVAAMLNNFNEMAEHTLDSITKIRI